MGNKIKKIYSLSILVFVVGFIGAFFGKSFEKTKLGQKIEKDLGLKDDSQTNNRTAQVLDCVQQADEEDDSVMFVGCNGFF